MTTGRINQVCASPPAARMKAQEEFQNATERFSTKCDSLITRKQPSSKMVTARFQNLRLDTRRRDTMKGFTSLQRALTEGFRMAPNPSASYASRAVQVMRQAGSLRCRALQFPSSSNTHKGPCLKGKKLHHQRRTARSQRQP